MGHVRTNPWLAWLGPMAEAVRAQRKAGSDTESASDVTRMMAESNPWLWWLRPFTEATKGQAAGAGDPVRLMTEANPWLQWLRPFTEAARSQSARAADPSGVSRMMTEANPWLWWLRPLPEAVKPQPAGVGDVGAMMRMMAESNPWLPWLRPLTGAAMTRPAVAGDDEPARHIERMLAEATSAVLDYYRDMRDAMSESAFFLTYGNLFSLYLADKREAQEGNLSATVVTDPRDLPFVKDALASLEQGGYAEALARVGALINRDDERIPLARLEMRRDLFQDYAEFLPAMPREQMRRIRGEQDIIVRYEPERALLTLPKLLADPADRERLVTLIKRLLADERMRARKLTAEDLAQVDAILGALGAPPRRPLTTVPRSA